ncbi:MAG: EamA family transporter RarD [Alphaproteobacteria bacterium]|nr:EamA family transporter RarD [Alphaproteobacteria bacterium]
MSEKDAHNNGVIYAATAFAVWGIIPIFWKQMAYVPAIEIVMHRILWSLLFAGGVIFALGKWPLLREALTTRKTLQMLTVSALLIGMNWGLFIWAVNVGRIEETSLGYYINPLVNFALGVVLLGERLTRIQLVAVGLAAVGVLNQTIAVGVLPWISITLAVSFGLYGLIRKHVPVESLVGLTIEAIILTPIALSYLIYLDLHGTGLFLHHDRVTDLLLVLAGPLTAIPLLLFAAGVRRIKLSTIGFLQYLAPSISLVLAVVMYNEPFTAAHAVTFGLIWLALALISWEALTRERYSAA